jgi:hypothetical protein
MIVKSSNLATNVVLEQVWAADRDAVTDVWAAAGATTAVTPCGIEDHAARDAG